MKSLCSCAVIVILFVGCSQSETAPVAVESARPVAFNTAGAPTVKFSVPDMVCESCSAAVHETLAKQPGAQEVTVDLESKVATVAVNGDSFDEEAAVEALLDKQFPNAKLLAAPEKPVEPAAPAAPAAPESEGG